MSATFVEKGGKHFLNPGRTNKENKRRRGRPRGGEKLRIYPKKSSNIEIPLKNIKTFINGLPPWDVELKGKEEVPVFRSCADVIKYEHEPRKLIELMYKAGIIKKTRPCNRKNGRHICDGTLMIVDNPKAKGYWAKYGGYYYECVNSGLKKGQCSSSSNNKKASILTGTLMHERMTPFQLIKLLYSYSVISHTVKFSLRCFIYT